MALIAFHPPSTRSVAHSEAWRLPRIRSARSCPVLWKPSIVATTVTNSSSGNPPFWSIAVAAAARISHTDMHSANRTDTCALLLHAWPGIVRAKPVSFARGRRRQCYAACSEQQPLQQRQRLGAGASAGLSEALLQVEEGIRNSSSLCFHAPQHLRIAPPGIDAAGVDVVLFCGSFAGVCEDGLDEPCGFWVMAGERSCGGVTE